MFKFVRFIIETILCTTMITIFLIVIVAAFQFQSTSNIANDSTVNIEYICKYCDSTYNVTQFHGDLIIGTEKPISKDSTIQFLDICDVCKQKQPTDLIIHPKWEHPEKPLTEDELGEILGLILMLLCFTLLGIMLQLTIITAHKHNNKEIIERFKKFIFKKFITKY